MKEELKEYADSEGEKLESKLKEYADSEDEVLENRLHDWHNTHMAITLEGSNAGPDRGHVYYQGRPLCNDGKETTEMWDLDDGHVVCRMLGYNKATKVYGNQCPFGSCPPAGIPFAMSGLKCTGSEMHILDCPHDATVPSRCGNYGVTYDNGNDIVAVECA